MTESAGVKADAALPPFQIVVRVSNPPSASPIGKVCGVIKTNWRKTDLAFLGYA